MRLHEAPTPHSTLQVSFTILPCELTWLVYLERPCTPFPSSVWASCLCSVLSQPHFHPLTLELPFLRQLLLLSGAHTAPSWLLKIPIFMGKPDPMPPSSIEAGAKL